MYCVDSQSLYLAIARSSTGALIRGAREAVARVHKEVPGFLDAVLSAEVFEKHLRSVP